MQMIIGTLSFFLFSFLLHFIFFTVMTDDIHN
jgi:hypothetical protein